MAHKDMTLPIEPEAAPLAVDEYGRALVGGTRIPLETVIGEFLDGASAETIVQNFDTLALADVYATFAYYLRHRDVVDAYLAERAEVAARVRAECERRFPRDPGLRERLVRRRAERTRT